MTLSSGTPVNYSANTISTIDIAIAELSSTKLVGIFYDQTDNDLKGVIFTVSGLTISAGTPVQIDATASDSSWDVAGLASNKALVTYTDNGGAISAVVLTVTGTSFTVGAVNTVDATGNFLLSTGAIAVTALSNSAAIIAYRDTGNSSHGTARALDITGDTVSAGSEHVFNAATSFSVAIDTINLTQAIVVYLDNSSTPANRGASHVLTKTGSGMASGSQVLFTAAAILVRSDVGVMTASLATVAYKNGSNELEARTLSITGTTITANAATTIDAASINNSKAVGKINSTTAIVTYNKSGNTAYAVEVIIAGTAVSGDTPLQVDASIGVSSAASTHSSPDTTIIHGDEATVVRSSNAAATGMTLAAMTKPADINADGDFIYIAALDSGNPILIKISSDLDTDGSTVFDPGSGSDIGVQCGKFDSDTVWVAGAFDGTNTVEKSENAGSTFEVKDNGTFGNVEAFIVGPDSDGRVLIVDDNVNIEETIDSGDSWTQINAGTGFNVNAIARLSQNVQESVFGNDAGAVDNISYSPNSGEDMEDFSAGFASEDITGVIVN